MQGQLVTLLVFLSVLHLGRLEQTEDDVKTIKNILVELTPFMKDIKSIMNYQESNLTSFNESIHQLATRLEELAQLQTSLQMNMESLNANLSQHQLQTQHDFDQLQTSLNDIQGNITYILGLYTCGGTGGWRRVVYLDMTDSTSTCPSGWQLTGYSKRTCGRASAGTNICDSATFPVSGGEYSKVCGKMRGYQWGTPDAFSGLHSHAKGDGVSLTHGSPQQHIWTFAVGTNELQQEFPENKCPCDTSDHENINIPSFVGEDYFCESGVNGAGFSFTLYPDDPLWDGENCGSSSSCCSFNSPPYFTKQLPAPTTDDIEASICFNGPSSDEDVAIELVELYVQ